LPVDRTHVILIVDDDPDDIFMLQDAMRMIEPSVEIIEAYDGVAALAILDDMEHRALHPDLIIIDINMPVMDGRELLSLLKSRPSLKDVRTVVYTTSTNPFDKAHCQIHNTELIHKPFTMEKLRKVAARILSMIRVKVYRD
jgi:CheY-like chemotaxis protein